MKNQIKLLLAATLLVFASCEKAKDGQDGKNGSTIHSGAGMPKMSTGNSGDFYMDTVSRVLWGPKTDNGWGNGAELGTKTILSGTVNPTSADGQDGDFYLNTSSKVLFGPKTSGNWGLGTSLIINGFTSTVIYTQWSTVASASKDTTIDGSQMKASHMYPSSLSKAIVDEGLMLTFFRIPGAETNYPLPYTSNAGGKANTMRAFYSEKRILITRFTHDNSASVGMSSSLQYKSIFIPGNLAGSPVPLSGNASGEKSYVVQLPGHDAPIDLRSLSYEEICDLFHISK